MKIWQQTLYLSINKGAKMPKKTKINPITISEVDDYLRFITDTLVEILVNRRVFMDFDQTLRTRKTKGNKFISFVVRLYYNQLILNLCKLLEYKTQNQSTLRHFINTIKDVDSGNYHMLENCMRNATIDMHDIDDHSVKKMSIGEMMLAELKQIDFEADLSFIESIYDRMQEYRNKRLCHNDKDYSSSDTLPDIDELHAAVDKLKMMFVTYFHICRKGIDFSNLDRPNRYGDFTLFMK